MPKGSISHSVLQTPQPIINYENASQTFPRANLMEEIPQL